MQARLQGCHVCKATLTSATELHDYVGQIVRPSAARREAPRSGQRSRAVRGAPRAFCSAPRALCSPWRLGRSRRTNRSSEPCACVRERWVQRRRWAWAYMRELWMTRRRWVRERQQRVAHLGAGSRSRSARCQWWSIDTCVCWPESASGSQAWWSLVQASAIRIGDTRGCNIADIHTLLKESSVHKARGSNISAQPGVGELYAASVS